ncbi:MAG: DUF4054 domain-containing protein [Spirochaetaceae bacterium]|nr:DUF4054 domain-containing protein [Spirochaetaceae bacterium]
MKKLSHKFINNYGAELGITLNDKVLLKQSYNEAKAVFNSSVWEEANLKEEAFLLLMAHCATLIKEKERVNIVKSQTVGELSVSYQPALQQGGGALSQLLAATIYGQRYTAMLSSRAAKFLMQQGE